MDKAFVTGWPVEHSRSPMIHNYWLNKYDLVGRYEIRSSQETEFADFLRSFGREDYVGGNITLPHKERAFQLVDEMDADAKAIGAVNTVWREKQKLMGLNSDVYGFLANIDEQFPGWDTPNYQNRGALVLGAGGASRAIIYGLKKRGFAPIWIANRTISKAQKLVGEFGSQCVALTSDKVATVAGSASVIVNCTSLGMGDDRSPLDLSTFQTDTLVSDIVYVPLTTPFLAQAKLLGMKPVDGLGMLLHQAVLGFEKWFGIRPEVTQELRKILIADLSESK